MLHIFFLQKRTVHNGTEIRCTCFGFLTRYIGPIERDHLKANKNNYLLKYN
jgi:hypothetical protein